MRDAIDIGFPPGIEIIEIELQLHLAPQFYQRKSILVASDAKPHTANIFDIGMVVVDSIVLPQQPQAVQQTQQYHSHLFHSGRCFTYSVMLIGRVGGSR